LRGGKAKYNFSINPSPWWIFHRGFFYPQGETTMSIVFKQGYTWTSLPPTTIKRMVDVDQVRARFAVLREEWTEATGGELESVTVNLESLFNDLDNVLSGEEKTK